MTHPTVPGVLMLPLPFSFGGRMGRWSLFKAEVLLVLSAIVPVFFGISAYDKAVEGNMAGVVGLLICIALYGIAAFWISLSLQVRRCRDIGWNPAVMVTTWVALQFVDPILAHLIPAMAIGQHGNTTPIGAIFNLVWMLALSFWPGQDGGGPVSLTPLPPGTPSSRVDALRAATPALATHRVAMAGPARTGFGRR